MQAVNCQGGNKMAYKGIVSRGEHERGVTLRAKVVSPNKRFSKTKDYHVRISAKTMSDEEKVLAALTDHKQTIIKDIGKDNLDNILNDFKASLNENDSFGYGTKTSYSILGNVSKYFDNDKNISGRPKYGTSESASGVISITTTMPNTSISMTTNIPISMKSPTAEELRELDIFSKTNIWNNIRGSNEAHDGNNTNPYKIWTTVNIGKALISAETRNSILTDIADIDPSDPEIYFTWEVDTTDQVVSILMSEGGSTTGVAKRLALNGNGESSVINVNYIPYATYVSKRALLTSFFDGQSDALGAYKYAWLKGMSFRGTLHIKKEDDTEITKEYLFNSSIRTGNLIWSEIQEDVSLKNNNRFVDFSIETQDGIVAIGANATPAFGVASERDGHTVVQEKNATSITISDVSSASNITINIAQVAKNIYDPIGNATIASPTYNVQLGGQGVSYEAIAGDKNVRLLKVGSVQGDPGYDYIDNALFTEPWVVVGNMDTETIPVTIIPAYFPANGTLKFAMQIGVKIRGVATQADKNYELNTINDTSVTQQIYAIVTINK